MSRRGKHPYDGLPDAAFWDRAEAGVPRFAVDPLTDVPFCISPADAIATAGSCFAQHLSHRLAGLGFRYFVTEPGPAVSNYGVFSARYGNLYTARQLLQLFDRSYGKFRPRLSHWRVSAGEFLDPFRPRIQPGGFPTVKALEEDRERHFACVRELFEKLDVLIFTLGLTEGWEYKEDGAVVPLAPGVAGGEWYPSRYGFRNDSCAQVTEDLLGFLDRLRQVNPNCRVILTVSPVPLRATYEPRHVLVSTCLSKSVLRAAADACVQARPGVAYFPAYEIVTGPHAGSAYFEDDLRSVTELGVDHVMRVFFAHYAESGAPQADAGSNPATHFSSELAALEHIVCEEGELDDAAQAPAAIVQSPTPTARMAVIGNCMAYGLTSCLRFFQPSAEVTPFLVHELSGRFRDAGEVLAELAAFDVVVVARSIAGIFGALDEAGIVAGCRKVIQCPSVGFFAFHPDCVYAARRDTGERLHSAMGEYNSALALLAYVEGLGVEEALRLFHSTIYARAGYFDAWADSEASLMRSGREAGFPLEKLFRGWNRRGCFMHSINHPKLFVFADMAAEILRRCGIDADARMVESYLADELLIDNLIWPLYPELGRALSLPGSYIFRAWKRIFDLRGFVEESFRRYSAHPQELISCARIGEWRGDAAFMDAVRERLTGYR